MVELREYQEEAAQKVIDAYHHNPSGEELLVLPCGAGKTVVFSHVADTLAREHGLQVLVLAHLDELLEQAADKYRMIKPDAIISKLGSGVHEYGGEVLVAGVQTISREKHLKHLQTLYGTGKKLFIIVDEAHLSAAQSYQKVLNTFPDAFVLKVTATPYRLDGKPVCDKPALYTRTIQDMISLKHLVDIKAVAIRTDINLDEVKTTAGDFNERDLDLAVNTPARNKRVVDAYLEHTPGKRALVFCVTVAHAENLAEAFKDAGVTAAVVCGTTPLQERQRIYKAFDHGEIPVLTTVNVLSIGFDSPRAEVAILARPTQSQALYVQQIGRVLRLAPNKPYATLLDITDNSMRMRIAPQNFKKVLKVKDIKEDETLLDALEREEVEEMEAAQAEKQAMIRKLKERRQKDIALDLFALPDWKELDNGAFVLEVGPERHRIALWPIGDGYEVCAKLAPTFKQQKWTSPLPLDWAMGEAEKRAHQLLAGERTLVDENARWRKDGITEKQEKFLKWKKIPVPAGCTRGQAAKLIDDWKRKDEQKKAETEAKKQEKAKSILKQPEVVPGQLNTGQPFRLMR